MHKSVLSRLSAKISNKLHTGCLYHKAHTGTHCFYFGAVAWEAHGMYGIAAGVLLVMTIGGWLLNLE